MPPRRRVPVVLVTLSLVGACASSSPSSPPADARPAGLDARTTDSTAPPPTDDAGSAKSGDDGAPAPEDAAPVTDDAGTSDGPSDDANAPPPTATVDGGPVFMGTAVAGTVTITRGTPAGTLPPAFVGFSYEKTHLTNGFFTATNAPLIAMYKLLGPGLLRIGGNAVDRTGWQPAATPPGGGKIAATVGTVEVDALADFAHAVGWKVLYGVNFNGSTPATAAEETKYAAGKLGASLYGFEIGNEINYFGSYGAITAKWSTFAAAVKAALPDALLTGPAVDNNVTSWAVPFAHDQAAKISMLTQHYYRGDGASGTMGALMTPDARLLTELGQLETAVMMNKIRDGFRLAETNSFVNHGTPGVSNAFGAALWSIDFMFTNALHGSSGVNFHGGGPGQDPKHPQDFAYTPIGEANGQVTGARPVLYGMLLVSKAGSGDLLTTTVKAGALNVTAYAVATAEGETSVVLVNKDTKSGAKLAIDLGAPATSASALYLEAPSLTATTGITLGGAGIMPDGSWNPSPPFGLAPTGAMLDVLVPPSSAVLVRAK